MPRGRKCACICPSCKAGLVARKGNENEWHFAHDHRANHRPDRKCDISFESACRLFVIDLLKLGQIPAIATPALGHSSRVDKARFRPAKVLEGLKFSDSNEYEDVEAEVKVGDKEYTLEVFIDYPTRVRPERPRTPDSKGVLAFPVAQVRRRYLAVRGGPQVLARIVKTIFADRDAGKSWLYHPLIKKPELLPETREVMAEPTGMLTNEQRARIARGFGGRGHSSKAQRSESAVKAIPKKNEPRPVDQRGALKCFRCHHTWDGGESSGRVCPQCGSDKLSVFQPF